MSTYLSFIFLIYSDYSFVLNINCKKYYSYLINFDIIKACISFKYHFENTISSCLILSIKKITN